MEEYIFQQRKRPEKVNTWYHHDTFMIMNYKSFYHKSFTIFSKRVELMPVLFRLQLDPEMELHPDTNQEQTQEEPIAEAC